MLLNRGGEGASLQELRLGFTDQTVSSIWNTDEEKEGREQTLPLEARGWGARTLALVSTL